MKTTVDFSLIHKFKIGDTHILLDINSGIVHQLSGEAWDFLCCWEETGDEGAAAAVLSHKYGADVLDAIRDGFSCLLEEGLLFSRDPELEAYRPADEIVVKALCLHVAHDCNLRCKYCFAGTGSFGGERGLMDLTTGKEAIDFLFKACGERKHLEIDYFGGEPLLNFDIVKKMVYYGKEQAEKHNKILKQTLTTNAILLDEEKIAFLEREKIHMILSLDGRPVVHDRMRPFPGPKESYGQVLNSIKKYVQKQTMQTYYVRGTYTHYNTDFCEDVMHLVKEGLNRVSLEPVVAAPDKDYAIKEEDIPLLKKQYEKLAGKWLEYHSNGTPFSFFHFNISLAKGPCLQKRLSGCGAGHEYLAVSPEGNLYPCHQFVGNPGFIVGNVRQGIINKELGMSFKAAHVFNKEACQKCWARFFCSGGCHANAFNFNGDILKPYELGCELQKKRLECAICLQVKLQEECG